MVRDKRKKKKRKMTVFRRIKWTKPPVNNNDNQVTIALGDGRTFIATKAQIALLDTEEKLLNAVRVSLGGIQDIFVHKNRNGRWAIATGQAPAVWPEDETE